MRSNSQHMPYKLKDEEKALLSYEFSKDYIYQVLHEYQTKFNEVYRCFINIFRKIFYIKKQNKKIKEELANLINELMKNEKILLSKYKIILLYLKISKSGINNTDIYMQFNSEEEKKNFFALLIKRRDELVQFKKYMDDLECIKAKINNTYDKIMLMIGNEINK